MAAHTAVRDTVGKILMANVHYVRKTAHSFYVWLQRDVYGVEVSRMAFMNVEVTNVS
jgi:hypothetical protein